eukprot:CAMPEP_0174241176 /NCGR_PEP_ID=MMETSP0417-20130205/22108_1 /TAXON_ID=242541 /ORGANISM="Mayorella sp, Strain BSH-02190019" /LENGTH=531 /DNA_ID=CAMNT_0015320379 /DNA_START=105 /DNA_END=1700 /DNA_ORIENTATION=-
MAFVWMSLFTVRTAVELMLGVALVASLIWYYYYAKPPPRLTRFELPVVRRHEKGVTAPSTEPVRIFLGSWNMGDALAGENMSEYLKVEDCDLVVLGVQECALSGVSSAECEAKWLRVVEQECLGPSYHRLDVISVRDSIRLVAYAHRDLTPRVHSVYSRAMILELPVFRRKGAVAIAFSVGATTFAFLNCHLSAHQKQRLRRNADVYQILEDMRSLSGLRAAGFAHQDYSFLMGDMNYRIDLSNAEVNTLISEQRWTDLQTADQLLVSHRAGELLANFQHPLPHFPPTFKVHKVKKQSLSSRGPNPYNKQRIPAWCDRFCVRSAGLPLDLVDFSSSPYPDSSDHIPVRAIYDAEALRVVPASTIQPYFYLSFQSLEYRLNSGRRGLFQLRVHSPVLTYWQASTVPVSSPTNAPQIDCSPLQDLQTVRLSLAVLRTQQVFITAYEFDTSTNAQAIAGLSSISLSSLKLRGKSMFDVRLSFAGLYTGTLSGVLSLNCSSSAQQQQQQPSRRAQLSESLSSSYSRLSSSGARSE